MTMDNGPFAPGGVAPPSPGWYPDPAPNTSGQRWWDGSGWTAHARPSENKPNPLLPQWDAPPSKPSTRWKWILGTLGVVVVLMLVLSLFDWGGGGGQSAPARQASAADLDKTSYRELTARDWALIAKDPDAHVGEKVVIYGAVTQLDTATGARALRADTSGDKRDSAFAFDTNTVIREGDADLFTNLVEGDLVQLWVEVDGSTTYTTALDAELTAPDVTAYAAAVYVEAN